MLRKVLSGVDRIDLMDQAFKGKRLAVVTGGGAVDRNLTSTLDILTSRYQVVQLLNTIYGVRGDFRYGEDIPYYVDENGAWRTQHFQPRAYGADAGNAAGRRYAGL